VKLLREERHMSQVIFHSGLRKATAHEIEIAYDTFGDPLRKPLVPSTGWGGQLISWDEGFCRQLAGRGYWVIRYDYRDVGLSTKLDDPGVPDLGQLMAAISKGESVHAQYTLRDLALDLVGLLDALGIESAHLLGSSMGAGVAALVAIHHPQRVRSLILIGASTDDPELPPLPPEVVSVLLKPTPFDREGYVESAVEKARATHGTGLPFDEERERRYAAQVFDRGLHPDGRTRQLAANLATRSLKERMRTISAPTLVIFGSHDPFGVEHGVDTANTIPGAELLVIDRMGHSIHPEVWPEVIGAIARPAV
jgi:pimeloyl-ACP methyl ester carboxylesterase